MEVDRFKPRLHHIVIIALTRENCFPVSQRDLPGLMATLLLGLLLVVVVVRIRDGVGVVGV